MNQNWLANLQQSAAVLVPTRSLANTLNEQLAEYYISEGKTVWESANILIWGDYIKQLWQLNRQQLNYSIGARQLISSQQSLLLWTQVIESSRREEQALTLLNVQQTARAVQRSWTLMHDWRISIDEIQQDHVADTVQFIEWLQAYKELLSKRGLVDEPLLIDALCDERIELRFPYQHLILYAYDLINGAQAVINKRSEHCSTSQGDLGVLIERKMPEKITGDLQYTSYCDADSEVMACLVNARKLIEQDNSCSINIVIHDLQDRQAKVEQIARDVFYPGVSPLGVQQASTAYRFSLGQRLNDWAAIETALSLLKLLSNRASTTDLSFLLRNQFLGLSANYRNECRVFDRWLKRQRMRVVSFDQLPLLYEQCLADSERRGLASAPIMNSVEAEQSTFLERLNQLVVTRQVLESSLYEAKQNHGFAALSFIEWVTVFKQWLDEWAWSTNAVGNELNTVQHQLLNRWEVLLDEFASLATVQRQAGIKKALDLVQQMARDAMFLPKAVASPVLISSILEAVGRPADYCFIVGMNDGFPPAPKSDAFIPQRLFATAGHPDMSADSSFVQADKVMKNLLSSVGNTVISYARQSERDQGVARHCSALFRNHEFNENQSFVANKALADSPLQDSMFERYQDTQGPAWSDASRAKGGSKIFENQSNCPFKAFVTHQLGFQTEEEAEFGLDYFDRGNIVHHLLDLVWQQLQTQQNLMQLKGQDLDALIVSAISQALQSPELGLSDDKRTLLEHERPRLLTLLNDWFDVERKRPQHFAVIEREEKRVGVIGGIEFSYVIDRLDMADDGRTFIIDYKTGTVNRKDWVGEPIKSPQMPLYAVALSHAKSKAVSGIAYGSVRQHEHKYVELSDAGVFRADNKRTQADEMLWQENFQGWPLIFDQLANDFLTGKADVRPLDDMTCSYCDLQSVCRISQLKSQVPDEACAEKPSIKLSEPESQAADDAETDSSECKQWSLL